MAQQRRPPGLVWVRIEEQADSYLITVTQNENVESLAEVAKPCADVDGAVEVVRQFLVRFTSRSPCTNRRYGRTST